MSSLKYNKKMPGYIYCITNPQYINDDIYKLGYTAINLPFEDVKKKLLLRYETYFISPECVELFLVNLPVKAEKKLFDLLSPYNIQKELFKCDFETIIKPAMEEIKVEFNSNIVENKKDKYIAKIRRIIKKIPTYSKKTRDLSIFINRDCNDLFQKLNSKNRVSINNFLMEFSNYESQLFMWNRNGTAKEKQNKKKQLIDDLTMKISIIVNNFDWNDDNLNAFITRLLQF